MSISHHAHCQGRILDYLGEEGVFKNLFFLKVDQAEFLSAPITLADNDLTKILVAQANFWALFGKFGLKGPRFFVRAPPQN